MISGMGVGEFVDVAMTKEICFFLVFPWPVVLTCVTGLLLFSTLITSRGKIGSVGTSALPLHLFDCGAPSSAFPPSVSVVVVRAAVSPPVLT